MTEDQIRLIPLGALFAPGTAELREWLHARGLRLTLAELDDERRRRAAERQGRA